MHGDAALKVILKRIDDMREGTVDGDLRSLKAFIEGVFEEAELWDRGFRSEIWGEYVSDKQ